MHKWFSPFQQGSGAYLAKTIFCKHGRKLFWVGKCQYAFYQVMENGKVA